MATCKFCQGFITWRHDDDRGLWLPCNEDGARHKCLPASQPRESAADAYQRGYRDGSATGFEAGLAAGLSRTKPTFAALFPGISASDVVRLTHPDLHPKEKAPLANRITARLLELR